MGTCIFGETAYGGGGGGGATDVGYVGAGAGVGYIGGAGGMGYKGDDTDCIGAEGK
jgi:hypothetical protein